MLSLNIRKKSALYAAYMPSLKGGGFFIPTNKSYRIGDDAFMLLSLLGDPNKLPVAGHVVWITPASKVQGIGVQFNSDDSGAAARIKIEGLGDYLQSSRPTHTM